MFKNKIWDLNPTTLENMKKDNKYLYRYKGGPWNVFSKKEAEKYVKEGLKVEFTDLHVLTTELAVEVYELFKKKGSTAIMYGTLKKCTKTMDKLNENLDFYKEKL